MKTWYLLSTSIFAAVCVTLMDGCATHAIFPDSSAIGTAQSSVTLGSFAGSEYGGHAPIVGAHVFVLQASTAGYGAQATSLLNTADTSGDTAGGTAVNTETTTAYGTYGMGYVTTDYLGDFNISGEYTCKPGLPVYLYATGGTSEVLPNSPITGGTVNTVSSTAGSITFASNNLLSVGQLVNFATISATGMGANALATTLDNTANVYTVTAATTSSFTVTGDVPSSATVTGGTVVLATSINSNNPAVGQMAVLGLCPTSSTTVAENFSSLSYVYMNEVSTVAAAYSLGGFMSSTGCAPANVPSGGLTVVIATDGATCLSIPAEGGNPLVANTISSFTAPTVAAAKLSPAWVGLQNATLNAAAIYNIQGTGAISSTTNGEGHIANATTPSGGTVSQALVNSLANSLAACVDSSNTAVTTGAPGPSTACTSLLGYALPSSTGKGGNVAASSSPTLSGATPLETATVAVNFAHNPWNPDYANIINLPTQTAPYSPVVSSAQDLAVTITYPMTNAQSGGDGGIAIDQIGNAWVTSLHANAVTELSPLGAVLNQDATVALPGMVAIDSTGAAWVSLRDSTPLGTVLQGAYKYSSAFGRGGPYGYASGANLTSGQGLYDNIWVTVDSGDAAYFTNHEFNNTLVLQSDGGITSSYSIGSNPGTGQTNSTSSTYDGPFANAFDGNGGFWMTVNQGQFNNVTRFTASGTTAANLFGNAFTGGNGAVQDPEGLAVDQNGNVWVASNGTNDGTYTTELNGAVLTESYYTNSNLIYKIASGGTGITPYSGVGYGLQNSTGVAVDGAGMVFFSCPGTVHNGASGDGTPGNGDLVVMDSNTSNFLTGGNGLTGAYVTGGTTTRPMANPYFLAVDNSGNLWVNTNTTIVEYMGTATPVLTPLSANLIGATGAGVARKP